MGSDRFCGSKKPGSGRQGSGPRRLRARGFEGFGVRWVPTVGICSRGLEEPVPETRGIKKVPGSGDSVPKVICALDG